MITELLQRHERIALQFSGGKDSMACLFLLRPWLDRVTVYWLNAGDPIPETVEVINACRQFIPHFVEVRSNVKRWRELYGDPSDVVPTSSSPLGRMLGFGTLEISDRFSCCQQNIMYPMYRRMKEDGITCVIRGQKLCDMPTVPLKSGDSLDGFEFFYPIENWSHEDVLNYLKAEGAPLHPCYELGHTGVDCLHCTAWWNESHLPFIKSRHPKAYVVVSEKIRNIQRSVFEHLSHLDHMGD